MTSPENISKYPRVEIHYMLKDDKKQYEPAFKEAVATYGEARPPEEEVSYISKENEVYAFINIGRTIFSAISYADIEHHRDVMQVSIEELVLDAHPDYDLYSTRAGEAYKGTLPDPE